MPLLERLFKAAGGKTHAATKLGLQRNYFSRRHKSIRRKVFNDALALLGELEQKNRQRHGEAEIVNPEPLGSVLREWVARWDADRPIGITPIFMGPFQWLSEQTGINDRRIRGICQNEFASIGITQADALLTAIGRSDMLGDEIPVHANPRWSAETWFDYMESRGCF